MPAGTAVSPMRVYDRVRIPGAQAHRRSSHHNAASLLPGTSLLPRSPPTSLPPLLLLLLPLLPLPQSPLPPQLLLPLVLLGPALPRRRTGGDSSETSPRTTTRHNDLATAAAVAPWISGAAAKSHTPDKPDRCPSVLLLPLAEPADADAAAATAAPTTPRTLAGTCTATSSTSTGMYGIMATRTGRLQ
ncbi:hypothetical protein Vafri_8625 [Volvox africanus]|uniref:Uncharacterized protein n=1 Tax=Volvox africanus TaxID=51714 RepID=A0A8J4B6Y0_9CHLO|nr:hypothetical protein Vafri_8625 [Volvox africanus]